MRRDRVVVVESARPAPGEELNLGEATVPRPASTVILLRGGAERLEVMLVQRNPNARFMGGAWVFPGGAVAREEGAGQDAHRAAALRELHEETGVVIDGPERLIPFSRWITPAEVKTRFDTWFYLAEAPDGVEPAVDQSEIVDARWFRADALPMIPPGLSIARWLIDDWLRRQARDRTAPAGDTGRRPVGQRRARALGGEATPSARLSGAEVSRHS